MHARFSAVSGICMRNNYCYMCTALGCARLFNKKSTL